MASSPNCVPNLSIPQKQCTLETCCIKYQGSVSYLPSIAGNAIYLAIFLILLLAQVGLGIKFRTWGFLAGMMGGLILEVLGYGGRLWMHNDIFTQSPFLLYLVPITIGPAFLTAAIYLTLARIIPVYGHAYSRFKPRTYTITFITCDFISLLLQAIGGAITSIADSGSSTQNMGVNIMIAGLSFQVVSLFVFISLSADFAFSVFRAKRKGSAFAPQFSRLRATGRFKLFLCALTLATILIFVRCCYRVAELKQGFSGALANNEAEFMVFEGPMIFIAVGALTVFQPGISFAGQWSQANFSLKGRKNVKNGASGTGDFDGSGGVGLESTEHGAYRG